MKKQTTGERIKLLRTEYRLTQAEFASIIKVSTLTISNIERGVTQTSYPETIKNIADKFGTTYEWISEGRGEMLPNGKLELTKQDNDQDPYRDYLVQKLEKDVTTWQEKYDQVWQMLTKFTTGDINFLTAVKETA